MTPERELTFLEAGFDKVVLRCELKGLTLDINLTNGQLQKLVGDGAKIAKRRLADDRFNMEMILKDVNQEEKP